MKNSITALFLLFTVYCNSQNDVTVTYPQKQSPSIPKTWKSLQAIQKEWVKVEQDKDGYLIYEPCDGSTEKISFINSGIKISWRLEESQNYSYEKFTRLIGNKAFRMDAYDPVTKSWFEIKVKIIDSNKGIVLWEFKNTKWLMTPLKNYKRFRIIKNNCAGDKKKELRFLPIRTN